jgi:hypothetical protein
VQAQVVAADINGDGETEIVAADTRGNVAAFTPHGKEVWERHLASLISQVHLNAWSSYTSLSANHRDCWYAAHGVSSVCSTLRAPVSAGLLAGNQVGADIVQHHVCGSGTHNDCIDDLELCV